MDITIHAQERPWGHFVKFLQEAGGWVKRVEVNPGQRLSLQKHKHRSEKWNIVSGHGRVTINDDEYDIGPGSILNVPVGAIHRIANTGKRPLVFIEVACGDKLSEDDIIRVQDDYARTSKKFTRKKTAQKKRTATRKTAAKKSATTKRSVKKRK